MTIGTAHTSAGGFSLAVSYCATANAEAPQVATFPLDQSCLAIQAMVSNPSWPSDGCWPPGTSADLEPWRPRRSVTTKA